MGPDRRNGVLAPIAIGAIGLVGVAAIAAGCGEDDNPGASASPNTQAATTAAAPEADGSISVSQFVERADAVCLSHEQQMVEAFGALQDPGTNLPAFAAVLANAGSAVSGLTAELDAVPLPQASEDAEAYVGNLEESARVMDAARAAATQNDQAGVEAAVAEFGRLADETGRLGASLGFKECGRAQA